MSVRYIWEKSTSKIRYSWDIEGGVETHVPYNLGSDRSWTSSKDRLFGFTEQPELNRDTGKATYSGSYKSVGGTAYSIDTDEYLWCLYTTINGSSYDGPNGSSAQGTGSGTFTFTPMGRTDGTEDDKCVLMQRRWTNTNWKCTTRYASISAIWVGTQDNSGDQWYDVYIYSAEKRDYPDKFIEYLSSSSSSAYPDFDKDSDGYFYYSCDNDVIDPDKVTIPSLILYNDTITIELTESEDAINNSYGTISYTYQYKVDSGPWTDIATTSETTQTLKIPSGTSKIQVRALAKDNIGFTSSTYIYSDEVSVYASAPPTAPSYISVNRVIAGWQSTVTWGESTDSDGTIQNYTLERNYSQIGWTDVQSSLSRSFSESIQSSWTTVQYRVKAVDNSGTPSPYTTSELYQIKSDILMISGPTLKNFGIKMGTFGFSVEVYIAGTPSSNTVNVEIKVDDSVNYSQTVVAGTEALTEIDTTTLSEGDHTITVTATKGGYDTAVETYTFRIQSITLPSGGNVLQFQDSEGKPIMPVTIAKAVLLSDGTDLETKINSIETQMS